MVTGRAARAFGTPKAFEMLKEFEGANPPEDHQSRAALVYLLAIELGPYPGAIHRHTGFSYGYIADCIRRMKENGLMRKHRGRWCFYVSWLGENNEAPVLSFWLEVMCISGELVRMGPGSIHG